MENLIESIDIRDDKPIKKKKEDKEIRDNRAIMAERLRQLLIRCYGIEED